MADRIKELIKRLKNEYWYVRKAAAEALGKIGEPAVEPLIAALKDKDWHVRKAAAEAIEKIDPTWPKTEAAIKQVPEFIAALRDKKWHVREATAEALGKIADPRAVEPLIAALRDKDWHVRKAAAEAIGKIADPRAVDPLIAALRDEDEYVRKAAAEALEKIDPTWPKTEAAKSQIPEFIAALRDEDEYVRKAAAEAIEKIDPTWPKTEAAIKQVPEFIAALRDKNSDVQKTAAEALGEIGSIKAVESFIAISRDEDSAIQKAAAEALEKINSLQPPLLESYPDLLCELCYLRAEKKKIKIDILKSFAYIACRNCGSSLSLIKGAKQVIGLIGADIENYRVDKDKVYVNLWDEEEKKARNADIDTLEIRNFSSKKISYDWAINDVVRKLQDPSRPHDYLKKIPVVLRDSPPIPNDAMKTLKKEFREVKK